MKITKWVSIEKEIEFDLYASDLKDVIECLDPEDFKATINACAGVIRQIKDEKINTLSDAIRTNISEFFSKQADRFAIKQAEEVR